MRLIKANGSNFESKFFVFVSDVVGSYISYWKSVWFGRVHLNNGVKPRAVLNLERKKKSPQGAVVNRASQLI